MRTETGELWTGGVTTWMQHVGTTAHPNITLILISMVIKVKVLINWQLVSGCEQMIMELAGV